MPLTSLPLVRGLVLAAGAGRRMGGPKALLPAAGGGTLVEAAVRVLLDGGCDGVTVVVGAEAGTVAGIVRAMPEAADLDLVECRNWAEGMGASLREGLSGIRDRPELAAVEAVLVTLVDLPDLTPAVVHRLLLANGPFEGERAGRASSSSPNGPFADRERQVRWPGVLRRAAYRGKPGHPALIGRDFWDVTIASAVGDRGAREVYRTHPHELVECGDLATGRDVDTPEEAGRQGLPSTNSGRA